MLTELLQTLENNHALLYAYKPLEQAGHLQEIQNFYRIHLVYSSNALAGFSYTLFETKILLTDGFTAASKPLKDALAVLALAQAHDYMYSLIPQRGISETDLLTMHSLLAPSFENATLSSTQPEERSTKSEAHMSILLAREKKTRPNTHPFIHAVRFHKEFMFLSPFAEGNGRIARLLMNTLLMQRGYLPIVIPPLYGHEYRTVLENSFDDDTALLVFCAQKAIATQEEMLHLLKNDLLTECLV